MRAANAVFIRRDSLVCRGTYRNLLGEMAEAAEDVRGFANELVTGTISHLGEIDELIRLRTEHWRITRMAIVDRNLLRLAIFEFSTNLPRR